jgi:hypothetical protein
MLSKLFSSGMLLRSFRCLSIILIISICFLLISGQDSYATITLNWTAPTTNTDGSTLSDTLGYRVYYCPGTSCNPATQLDSCSTTTYSASLTAGTYCFSVSAYNGANESNRSNIVCKTEAGTPDTTAPTITTFTIPATAGSVTVSITTFTATDAVGVNSYCINESATAPTSGSCSGSGWAGTAQTSYVFSGAGAKTLYAWAKDAAGNVSASRSASVTITLADTTKPVVNAFTVPSASSSLMVSITSLVATDNVAVTGYMINESATAPAAGASGWFATVPTSYTSASTGTHTLYAWAKDAAGNVSASRSASVTITIADTTKPVVNAFTVPSTSSSLMVSITSLVATDNVAVSGYLINESATAPAAGASGWSTTVPSFYTAASSGAHTLYAWAKDAAGNVSSSRSALVTIATVTTTTINLAPADDTFINLDNVTNSTSETLNTYTWPNDKVANTILMKFNLSNIPPGAVIQSAALYLYLVESDTDASYPTYNLSLNRVINRNPDLSKATGYTYDGINAWTPNTYCYNNVPMAQADITTAYDTRAIDKTGGFKGWNATQLLADWIASPSINNGLMINSDSTKPADTYRNFASSKNANPAYHPYLTVTYTGGSPSCAANPKYKIGGGSMYVYPSIQSAYDSLIGGAVLQIQAGDFSGNLTSDQSKTVTIDGGYTCDFTSRPGYTTINGTLTINDGSMTLDRVIIR